MEAMALYNPPVLKHPWRFEHYDQSCDYRECEKDAERKGSRIIWYADGDRAEVWSDRKAGLIGKA